MLTPDFAYCHTATVERWIGRGIVEEEYAAPVSVKCRANFTARYLAGSQQATPTTTGTIWFPAGTQLSVKDRITVNGRICEVTAVNDSFDFFGDVNHVEAEVR